jgi:cyanophycin synthetase
MTALVELRVLDGPNLYVSRPAVKLTLDASTLGGLPEAVVQGVAASAGLTGSHPGAPGSGQRQRFSLRLLVHLTRQVAAASGTTRLAVRARPGSDVDHLILAFPWRHRGRAEALALAVVHVVDGLGTQPVDQLVDQAARSVLAADPGPAPDLPQPRIPVVSVTGTNGKTTTTRILAHLCMTAGLSTGWTSTDGVYADGRLVESGDWSGPGGARLVLDQPVQVAVLETARGGLLLRGMGVAANDVSVVTNVSADHLGLQGIDTVDQLAEVKAVITHVTRPQGWVVLNGEDPRVFAMRSGLRARTWVFALSPDSPAVRQALNEGGRAATVLDGDLVLLGVDPADPDPDHLMPVVDIPVTLAGLSPHNIANVLAATAAAFALGLPRDAVLEGLRTFVPDAEHNPGRMNVFDLDGIVVILDFAHNLEGLEALLGVADGLRGPGQAVRLALSGAGDRRDEDLTQLGALAAQRADEVIAVRSEQYLRGRTLEEVESLFQEGAHLVGHADFATVDGEVAALAALVQHAAPGDVVAFMCHGERAEALEWLAERNAVAVSPASLRRLAGAAAVPG